MRKDEEIRPYQIETPDDELADLRDRPRGWVLLPRDHFAVRAELRPACQESDARDPFRGGTARSPAPEQR